VHVPCLAADEGLVDLDLAVELLEGARLHGEPDAVEQEPCRLLSDPKRPAHLVGGNAVLGVGDQPHRGEPLVEPDGRVLEDAPDLDRELPLAALALPQSAGLEVGVLRPAA